MIRRDFLKSLLAGCGALSALSIERMAAAFDERKPERWLADGKWLTFPYELELSCGKEGRIVAETPPSGVAICRIHGGCSEAFALSPKNYSPIAFSFLRKGKHTCVDITLSPASSFNWLCDMDGRLIFGGREAFVISAAQPKAMEPISFSGVLVGMSLQISN